VSLRRKRVLMERDFYGRFGKYEAEAEAEAAMM
jgi:hypothetical protein